MNLVTLLSLGDIKRIPKGLKYIRRNLTNSHPYSNLISVSLNNLSFTFLNLSRRTVPYFLVQELLQNETIKILWHQMSPNTLCPWIGSVSIQVPEFYNVATVALLCINMITQLPCRHVSSSWFSALLTFYGCGMFTRDFRARYVISDWTLSCRLTFDDVCYKFGRGFGHVRVG